jgi:ankyrin repeat protein
MLKKIIFSSCILCFLCASLSGMDKKTCKDITQRKIKTKKDITNTQHNFPLFTASKQGKTDQVRSLLNQGADPSPLFNGHTSFHAAVTGGYIEIVTLLLNHTPTLINQKTSSNNTALHLAVTFEQIPMTQFLLSQPNISINEQNNALNTPLDSAYDMNNQELMELLRIKNAKRKNELTLEDQTLNAAEANPEKVNEMLSNMLKKSDSEASTDKT